MPRIWEETKSPGARRWEEHLRLVLVVERGAERVGAGASAASSAAMSWLWSTPNQPFRDFKRVPDPPEDAHDRHALALARAQRTRDYLSLIHI